MNIYTYSLGAVEEVTGSKHVIEIDGKTLMVDCGSFQGDNHASERNRSFEFPVDKLKTVLLTHAHFDHCGSLPKLIKDGYKGTIRCTPATRDLASIVMLDSAKIQLHEKGAPAYEESDVIETINRFRCHQYYKRKELDKGIWYTMYNAGHILGSSMVDLEIDNRNFLGKLFKQNKRNMHILFTGDLGRKNNPITNPPDTNVPAPDYIFLESTYGNRLHEPQQTSLEELTTIVNKTVARGGKVIIPSFAIERAQELIYYLKLLMNEGKIERVPVYVDSPMASNATGVFNVHPECFNENLKKNFLSKGKNPFSVRSLNFISDGQESFRLSQSRSSCIVIAASGMCESGRILNHLKTSIPNPYDTILIVGYMGEGTLGRKILERQEKLTIDKKEYTLKCGVEKIGAFSAHADYAEILEWLSHIDTSQLKKVFLVHGDKESQAFLQEKLNSHGFKTEIIKDGEVRRLN